MSLFISITLTACGGGGGGGGGGSLVSGGANSDGGGSSDSGSGSITLEISGLVDAAGNEDATLSGNELATLTATVTENGSAADVVVLFETSIGRLLTGSAQSADGTATVQITGDGTAGAATVTARATLSGGLEVEASIIVQMSAESPKLTLLDSSGAEASTVELGAAETAVITAQIKDWNGNSVEGVGINFVVSNEEAITASILSGATNASGELEITLAGTQIAGTGTLTASATYSEFELEGSIPANGLGVDESLNNIVIDTIDVGADGVLAGNEKTQVVARVTEDGVAKNGIVVEFSTNGTGGSLSDSSSITANNGTTDGVASVQIVGDATPGTADITVTATLSNGIAVEAKQSVQTSAEGPAISLVARNAAGSEITTFGANQILTLEATIVDQGGGALSAEDASVNVTFDVGALGTTVSASDVAEFAVCPVNGVKANADCAYVVFTSNTSAGVGEFKAQATINSIVIEDALQVENTGINSGSPDQDSFTITREFEGLNIATTDTLALEGDLFNNITATITVDLADFFNNPVPDGTLVEFLTELGDISQSCETTSGQCDVTFTTSDPRKPNDTEVSFRNVDDDYCPDNLIIDEVVTPSSGVALTEYRVDDVLRVTRDSPPTTVLATNTYNVTADGLECISFPCSNGTKLRITYKRLWLDELDDGATAHVVRNPGQATEPYLATRGTSCFASSRSNLVELDGEINPDGTTSVTGVGTDFERQLKVGDKLKVSGEIRTITAIASDTQLTVDSAFGDNLNDLAPERIAAPAYLGGLGQPYGSRSTILAYAIGEESFVDANGNEEYDFGESFDDLPEVFIDKNEDGVLGDVNGDSAAATAVGPYQDNGTGDTPAGGKRDKSSPYCYGPRTIVGDPAGPGSSTEQEVYCYQDGGEEELFIDADDDGVMDLGNGIYNGSRCLTPLQDSDGDGDADDLVCTTDLVNISRETQILMAGTAADISFRSFSGGAYGGGEIISRVQSVGGLGVANTAPSPPEWDDAEATAVLSQTVQKGADVNTGLLAGGSRDVELFTLSNVFTRTDATWTLSFEVTRTDANTGDVEVFASGFPLTFDNGDTCGDVASGATDTCTVTDFSVNSAGDLIVASAHDTNILGAEINNFSITATTTGFTTTFQGGPFTSNDNSDTNLTEFEVGSTLDATTVFPGVTQRNNASLVTTNQAVWVYFTDKYNGQLPDGTVVTVQSDNSAGCTLASVGGVTVNSETPGPDAGVHSGSVTVGSNAGTGTWISLTTGYGSGSVIATAVTPSNTQSSASISCQL